LTIPRNRHHLFSRLFAICAALALGGLNTNKIPLETGRVLGCSTIESTLKTGQGQITGLSRPVGARLPAGRVQLCAERSYSERGKAGAQQVNFLTDLWRGNGGDSQGSGPGKRLQAVVPCTEVTSACRNCAEWTPPTKCKSASGTQAASRGCRCTTSSCTAPAHPPLTTSVSEIGQLQVSQLHEPMGYSGHLLQATIAASK
jgi:hypothetical protein